MKALIDTFGTLTNEDFHISLVDEKYEKGNSVLTGVSFPSPCVPFVLPARQLIPFPSKRLPRRLFKCNLSDTSKGKNIGFLY